MSVRFYRLTREEFPNLIGNWLVMNKEPCSEENLLAILEKAEQNLNRVWYVRVDNKIWCYWSSLEINDYYVILEIKKVWSNYDSLDRAPQDSQEL